MNELIAQRAAVCFLALYIISGILAFGHCSAHRSLTPLEKRNGEIDSEIKVVTSFGAALFNPFYWSMVLFENEGANLEKP